MPKLDQNMQEKEHYGKWQWYNAKQEPIRLSGLPYFGEDKLYRRLPLKPAYPIRNEVDQLANCTAGVQASFQTDSPLIVVKVVLDAPANMYNMPATSEAGLDIYEGHPKHMRYVGTTNFDPRQAEYQAVLSEFADTALRNFTVNFPLYKGVKELLIGVVPDSKVLAPLPYDSNQSVVVYGTSITQGASASRPGMAYTNILSRKFNREFINLGFSGNGKGDPELARLIANLPDIGCIVLDYEPNCVDTATYGRTLPEFIRIIRNQKPVIPLLVISRIRYAKELCDPKMLKDRLERLEFQRELVNQLQQAGDKAIFFLSGEHLLGEDWDECTIDGVHPNDLGFYRMASAMASVLQTIIE